MKVAVLKADLAKKEYRKKQEMLFIFRQGIIPPSGLFHVNSLFLPTRALARGVTCASM